jgi:hypothetical protein
VRIKALRTYFLTVSGIGVNLLLVKLCSLPTPMRPSGDVTAWSSSSVPSEEYVIGYSSPNCSMRCLCSLTNLRLLLVK